jgi:Alpha-galactosidase
MYKNHPDWVVRHPYKRVGIGRGQYVLDFANPEVVDAVYQQMKPTIAETNLDYIKWDMNRNITEAYSPYLAKINRPQGEFFHRYILGVYALYQKILTDFPNILIEGCSGGGGRFDLGILFYSPQIWPSDDSDAIEKLDILTGTTLAYPLSAFSNHVSAIPNDQVKRNTPLTLRQDVSDFGPLGYELDITKLDDEQKQKIKNNIAFYKQNRQLLLHGRLQQLVSVDPASNLVSWGVTDNQKSESFIGFYRKIAQPNSAVVRHIAVPFLDETKHYAVDDKSKVSGRILKNIGLLEPFEFNGANLETAQISGDYQSWMYHLIAKD